MFPADRKIAHMSTRTDVNQANDMAGVSRVRGFRPCPVSPAAVASMWAPISLGTTAAYKHGRPRLPEVSHP